MNESEKLTMSELVRLNDIILNRTAVCSVEVKRASNGDVHFVEIQTLGGRVDCYGKNADKAIELFFFEGLDCSSKVIHGDDDHVLT